MALLIWIILIFVIACLTVPGFLTVLLYLLGGLACVLLIVGFVANLRRK